MGPINKNWVIIQSPQCSSKLSSEKLKNDKNYNSLPKILHFKHSHKNPHALILHQLWNGYGNEHTWWMPPLDLCMKVVSSLDLFTLRSQIWIEGASQCERQETEDRRQVWKMIAMIWAIDLCAQSHQVFLQLLGWKEPCLCMLLLSVVSSFSYATISWITILTSKLALMAFSRWQAIAIKLTYASVGDGHTKGEGVRVYLYVIMCLFLVVRVLQNLD